MLPKKKKGRKFDHKAFNKAHNPINNTSDNVTTSSWTSTSSNPITGHIASAIEALQPEPPRKKARITESFLAPDSDGGAAPFSDSEAGNTTTFVDNPEPPTDPPAPVSSSKLQGASDYMRMFMGSFQKLVAALFSREVDTSIGSNCSCGSSTRSVRCSDCLQSPATCNRCFVSNHANNPTHWAEVWNGDFFERQDISKLGYVLTLGHNGDPCPTVDYTSSTHAIDFILVDLNGIHNTRVVQCNCAGSGEREDQLLRAAIFPATTKRPSTGFTFNLLKLFHLDTLESKKSAYDFMKALRRRTNNAFPQHVPNPYGPFLTVMRVWRWVVMYKRSGQAHGIDKFFSHRPPGSVAVPCFGCPEHNFNLDDEWQTFDEDMKHLVILYLSADGHFGLQRKKKSDDPDDVSLTGDAAFFPADEPYNQYIAKAGESTEKSTCAKLNVVNMQNKMKFKGSVITGVVSVNCARHNVFQHNGMVDLQKGEKYANTDYALAGALKHRGLLPHIVLTYDIACQYSINLKQRIRDNFPALSNTIERLQLLIPKLHLQGHKDDCQYRWSLNFTRSMGRTDGERIEGGWAEAKQAGGSTKEMNHGHRHDVLNDFQNDWNWLKAQNLATSLFRHYTNAIAMAKRKLEHWQGLSKLNGRQRIEQWEKLPIAPCIQDKEWYSVYRYKEQKVPSQVQVYHEMLARESKEMDNIDKNSKQTSTAVFLSTGLKLQSRQYNLSNIANADGDDAVAAVLSDKDLEHDRLRLRADIKKWRSQQQEIMPKILDFLVQLPYSQPENELLCMPSDFTLEDRIKYGINHLAHDETKLREGEAYDALRSLRSHLKYGMSLRRYKTDKRNSIVGQDLNTRTGKMIRDADRKTKSFAQKYRRARKAMLTLGLADSSESPFPELKDQDMYTKPIDRPHQLGQGSVVEGWIWRKGPLSDMSDAEHDSYAEDADRVQWFRARADMERWQEEIEILAEEFKRAVRGFRRMSEIWSQLGDDNISPGHTAYAREKAAMYAAMAEETGDLFERAGGTWPPEGVSLVSHVRSLRPSTEIEWDSLEEEEAEAD